MKLIRILGVEWVIFPLPSLINILSEGCLVLHWYQLTEYGLDGSVILLRICVEQVHLREAEVPNLQLKLELLACVLRRLVHQPNFSTIFCEAVRQIVSQSDDNFLGSLSQSLNLTLPEQIRIGLALLDAEDLKYRQEGKCNSL